ncbi:hypothetical protein U1Q18_051180 [Sarracenia purpurea var. burkii]
MVQVQAEAVPDVNAVSAVYCYGCCYEVGKMKRKLYLKTKTLLSVNLYLSSSSRVNVNNTSTTETAKTDGRKFKRNGLSRIPGLEHSNEKNCVILQNLYRSCRKQFTLAERYEQSAFKRSVRLCWIFELE